jgi:hypothetical protein
VLRDGKKSEVKNIQFEVDKPNMHDFNVEFPDLYLLPGEKLTLILEYDVRTDEEH